jgi:DNA-directed RNA polymerase specialized sigma subunit
MVRTIVQELISRRLIKNTRNAYENTEMLLYKLNTLPEAIKELRKEVERLETEAGKIPDAPRKSNTIVLRDKEGNEGTYIYGDETLATRISELKQIITKTNSYVRLVKNILKRFEDDEYYPIIEYVYFNKKTYDAISNDFGWATGTISKHKARLINELKVFLFPNNFIDELGN